MRALLLAALMALVVSPAFSVLPDEILDDPVLEARARDLSKELRCLVCRNQSIDDSNADLARDLRLLVRERLVAGDTDDEVLSYLVDRYGEFVLLRPTFSRGNLVLWLGGPAMLLLGGLAAARYIRRGRSAAPQADAPLSEAESKRLQALLQD